jgi:hypothetical protein
MRAVFRVVLLPIAAVLMSAVPPERVILFPGVEGEALILPRNNPVRFSGFYKQGGEYVGARFSGRFVLTGSFTYGCEWDCGEPGVNEDENYALRIIPDRALAARLPHWKVRNNDIAIFVSKAKPFTHAITTPEQRAALASPTVPNVQGRISIVVDHLETSLDCDSANFRADFVKIAKPPELSKVDLDGNFGCG